MSTCRWCLKDIRFVATPSGKRMPIDVDPVADGNVVIIDGLARVLTADQLARRTTPTSRFMPHAATCDRGRPR